MNRIILISNAIFIAPLIIAFYFGVSIYVYILIGVILVSFGYHAYNNKGLEKIDTFFAALLITANFVLIILSKFKFPFAHLALILGAIALWVNYNRKMNYKERHAIWHTLSAIICIFPLLAFGIT